MTLIQQPTQPPTNTAHGGGKVLQLVLYEVPATFQDEDDAWLYIRILGTLPTFLQQDTVDITRNPDLIAQAPAHNGHDITKRNELHHPYMKLQHSKLPASAVRVHPERDVLWFSRDNDDDEYLKDMSKYYDRQQLGAIQNALFEECEWNDIQECLRKMSAFTGIRTIYVWLESYLYTSGEVPADNERYHKKACEFRERDEQTFAGDNITVVYIDHERNIHGGILA